MIDYTHWHTYSLNTHLKLIYNYIMIGQNQFKKQQKVPDRKKWEAEYDASGAEEDMNNLDIPEIEDSE